MDFTRSRLIMDRTMATEVISKDLPVNPLSHLIISIEGYNVTDEATLAEILAFINKIEVMNSSFTVLSLESEDLAGLNQYLYKKHPILTQNVATDNATRMLSLIVPFGRRIFDPAECFPATKKGELTLFVDTTIPSGSLDNAIINIDCVELPGATPQRYLKSYLKTIPAPGATGDNDISLPIGNKIVALQLRQTTFPATSSHVYGVETCKVLIDNKEFGYASARAQCLVGDGIFHQGSLPRNIAAFGDIVPDNIYWLDFDPDRSNNWLLDTKGKSSVTLRLNMGVNEATNLSVFELVEA
jgi:hypothetical protein